jgi:hypothetical protein
MNNMTRRLNLVYLHLGTIQLLTIGMDNKRDRGRVRGKDVYVEGGERECWRKC